MCNWTYTNTSYWFFFLKKEKGCSNNGQREYVKTSKGSIFHLSPHAFPIYKKKPTLLSKKTNDKTIQFLALNKPGIDHEI
jgi:hypothetical protein